jgi:hypothetical protein
MRIFSIVLFVLSAGPVLSAQKLSPNVCAIQNEYGSSAEVIVGQPAQNQIVVVRGRAVFSPRGFWILTESGCPGIPLAEILQSVNPKVPFQLIKDEKYQELQNIRDRSRHEIVVVELEGRLDQISKKARNVREGGSGAIHISQYNYMLALRRVLAVQVHTNEK